MSVKQKLDVIDLIINVLREHERTLDSIRTEFNSLMERLESVCQEMEQVISEENPEPTHGLEVKTSTIFNLLENKAFTSQSFTFDEQPSPLGDHVLIDHVKKRTLIYGKSLARANIPLWNILLFQGTEEPYGEPLESYYFDSERNMLSWIIKYVLREPELKI